MGFPGDLKGHLVLVEAVIIGGDARFNGQGLHGIGELIVFQCELLLAQVHLKLVIDKHRLRITDCRMIIKGTVFAAP